MGALIIMIIVMAVISGPALAWWIQSPSQLRAHETKKAKFDAGRGKDPDKSLTGPHKSFRSNAIIMGATFAVVFSAFFAIGYPLGFWAGGGAF